MSRKLLIIFGFLFLLSGFALRAGVTIHFEGKVKDLAAQETIINLARKEAARLGWRVESGDLSKVKITRIINEIDQPYDGPLKGIIIYPHSMCEPLYLQFDSNLFIQDFIKTQFVSADIHIKIIELFRLISPNFSTLNINDEGEYWETSNRSTLERNIRAVFTQMDAIKKSHPGIRGPIKIPGGRIVDLIQ